MDEEAGMQIMIANLQLKKARLKERRPVSASLPRPVSCGDPARILGVRSPRTRAIYTKFRKGVKVKKLEIKTYSAFAPVRGAPPPLRKLAEEEEETGEVKS
jgi:hypothetical protein